MYHKVNRTEVLYKMDHIFERFKFISRSRSLSDEQINNIDYHLSEIIEVLNQCSG
ncbi:MAG: hypothetical protein HVN35_05850 [Methanobacteriaceae archaeon]|nr:hypothetical protein [Methanobacteriaceae archaeon]